LCTARAVEEPQTEIHDLSLKRLSETQSPLNEQRILTGHVEDNNRGESRAAEEDVVVVAVEHPDGSVEFFIELTHDHARIPFELDKAVVVISELKEYVVFVVVITDPQWQGSVHA
jgi:hypothetical protein